MNARLREIRLANFKCFRDVRLRLGDLTLLAGVNGAGKSTALQALLALRQSHLLDSFKEQQLSLGGPLVRLGVGQDVLHAWAEQEIITLGLAWDDDRSESWSFSYETEARELTATEMPRMDALVERCPFASEFCYLGADRAAPQIFFPLADQRLMGPHSLGNQGQFTIHYLSRFGDDSNQSVMKELRHPDEESQSLLPQVTAWLSEVRPGLRLTVRPHDSIDVVELGYELQFDKIWGRPFRPTNVGFGLTYTIPVLTALLSMPPGGLVLIENPEAHLHPRGQAKIGELCARAAAAGVQVILETHSDHVLNSLRVAVHQGLLSRESICIHFFTTGAGQLEPTVSSPRIDARGRLDQWPDGFFDEWDRALGALLD